jgi:hypothetical protein
MSSEASVSPNYRRATAQLLMITALELPPAEQLDYHIALLLALTSIN